MKKREIVLIVILVFLLSGVGYYNFYYVPSSKRITELQSSIDQKQADIDVAVQQIMVWGVLSNTKGEVEGELAKLVRSTPKKYDDANILYRMKKIIIPHTKDVTIKFLDTVTAFETTEIHTVEINFTVSYDTLQTILKDFADENIANRIIDINCYRVVSNDEDESEDSEPLYSVYMWIDFLVRPPVPAAAE